MAIPATIPANCSQDVSGPLKKWLNRLPANSTVLVSAQACYRVDKGLRLKNPTGLTIYGGTFTSDATTPGKKKNSKGHYVFDLVGGSNVTLESMKINGQNPGGYHPTHGVRRCHRRRGHVRHHDQGRHHHQPLR